MTMESDRAMENANGLPVLRCSLCNKPFDKKSALRRHGYYCRSRNSADQVKRAPACIPCGKAKARCDKLSGACTRCSARSIRCEYRRRGRAFDGSNFSGISEEDEVHGKQKVNDNESQEAYHGFLLDRADASRSEINLDLTGFHQNIDVGSLFDEEGLGLDRARLETFGTQYPSRKSMLIDHLGTDLLPYDAWRLDTLDTMALNTMSIPSMPPNVMRCFTGKSAFQGRTRVTATMMKRILTAYPTMMCNQDCVPPFVHTSFISDENATGSRSWEALTTCKSLMQLLDNGNGGDASRRLVWKNIRLECERIELEWTTFDKWELLSSMQALLVYMLLRLGEGERPDNNFDVTLLSAMWVAASALNLKIGNFDCALPFGLDHGKTYEDWIFEESRRRFNVVFRCLSMLFTTDGVDACNLYGGFLVAPLPARKRMWEAQNAHDWHLEKEKEPKDGSVYGIKAGGQMAKFGKLMNIEQNQLDFVSLQPQEPTEAESDRNWTEWCSGMDDLGALIILASSLRTEF